MVGTLDYLNGEYKGSLLKIDAEGKNHPLAGCKHRFAHKNFQVPISAPKRPYSH